MTSRYGLTTSAGVVIVTLEAEMEAVGAVRLSGQPQAVELAQRSLEHAWAPRGVFDPRAATHSDLRFVMSSVATASLCPRRLEK